MDSATEAFLAHRNLLFTVAYELLGSAADAEDEIAEAVGKSPAAVRQIAHRARAHVAARRPRGAVSPAEARDALAAFQQAVETGDLQSLLDLLAPDVVFLGDGGGVVPAALAPVVGADPVARAMVRIDPAASLEPAQVNGYPALIVRLNGQIDTVVAVRIDDGLITGLYAVRNPEKLSHMDRETALRR
jgi:RNA polymerase sigma-70 factor (ECF subfamily)